MSNASGRAAVYSAVGFLSEVVFSALHDAKRGRPVSFRTSPWMFPIYALIQPLYEPLHDAIRGRARLERAVVYTTGFFAIEYASGLALRNLRGEAPWDYSDAALSVHGLIRLDYAPYWAAAGLALERLHDRLVAEGQSG